MKVTTSLDSQEVLDIISYTDNDIDIVDLSHQQPILLIFLRHFGCTFCREALAEISQIQDSIKAIGVKMVFVHMTDRDTAEAFFKKFNLPADAHVSDPKCMLYQHFGLVKGTFRQLFGLSVMMRGFKAGMVEGHGHGFKYIGDAFQMPGIFIIKDGEIRDSYIHQLASDRPNYEEMAKSCMI